jgi:hypothetical protein
MKAICFKYLDFCTVGALFLAQLYTAIGKPLWRKMARIEARTARRLV